MADVRVVIFLTSIITFPLLLFYTNSISEQNRLEVYKWMDTLGLSKYKKTIYNAGVNHMDKHNCQKKCLCCHDASCQQLSGQAMVKCLTCNRYFKGVDCRHNHKSNGTCDKIQRCKVCFLYKYKGLVHICGKRKCMHCKEMVDRDHLCFMQKPKITKGPSNENCLGDDIPKKKQKMSNEPLLPPQIFYFDMEAIQETQVHKANLVVVQHEDGNPEKQKIFKTNSESNARDAFCNWIFKDHCGYKNPKQPIIFIAHYMKGYDGFFVLEYLYQHNLFPEAIFTGNKLMSLTVPSLNIKFIDSINFLAMPLAKFPNTFELEEMQKGYFPHFFNTEENQNYCGPMPDISLYRPDLQSPEARQALLKWYTSQVDARYIFDMPKELQNYCISDVNILREGCERFRAMCKDMFELDPLIECITLASYCQLVYRSHYMPEDSIAIIPSGGYGGYAKQSSKAIRWLEWLNKNSNGCKIQHARNGGEVKLLGHYLADGFQHTSNTVYEFQGCYYHGCPKCYTPETQNTVRSCTMGEAHAQTLDRTHQLREKKYNVVEIWECEFEHLLKTDSNAREFVNDVKIVDPLEPRDAFFGGRTNAAKLHYSAKKGEQIAYYDYVSLYPTINKYGKLPIGHPKIIPQLKSYTPGQYYGFIKCKALPPVNLYHPVLPYRSKDRLLFPLCKSCADLRQNTPCCHSMEDRSITGTWITPEIDHAIERGYTILETYEVWHFEQTAEYGNTKCQSKFIQGLFGGYVNSLLKIKQEASGWPEGVTTNAEKDQFIKMYQKKEGFYSLVHCALLGDVTHPSPHPSIPKLSTAFSEAFWNQLHQAAPRLREELILKQWLKNNGFETEITRLLLSLHSLDEVIHSNPSTFHDKDAAKWKKALEHLVNIAKNDEAFTQLKQNLWEKYVLHYQNTEWSFGGMVVFTVFVVAVVSAASMTQPVLSPDSQLAKRSFFEYVTGKYLVPQNCKVFFNWEEPCIVGDIMSFAVKFYQRNGRPYPICNKDHILVEITQGSLKVSSSVEVGSPDPSLANTLFVKFAVRRAGEYKIAIMIGNSHIKGSPFVKHFLPGPPDPLKTGFVHHCSTIVCTEGVPERLLIESRDEYNNSCTFQSESDPTVGYVVKIQKIGTKEFLPLWPHLEYDPASKRIIWHLKMEKEGCYRALVTYCDVTLRNGDFNIIVLNKRDSDTALKNVSKKNHNVCYEVRLLSCNGERFAKPKKAYCYLSPKQLTIREYFLKFIPKRLFTFRLCPSTKFQFYANGNEDDLPRLIIDDGCQPKLELATEEGNVIAATFTHYLLKNIGGSETFKDKRDFFYHEVRKLHSKKYHDKLPIKAQRKHILDSSMKLTKGFTVNDWCKNFEVSFYGEQGLDWGGLRREWFEMLCAALFDTTNQLFVSFKEDRQGLVHPNQQRPPHLKLKHFEFAGKIVGKCLYESALGGSYRQLVKARFTRSFLAQLIGLRVHFKYFEQDDPDLYVSKIKYLLENDVSDMELYFVEEVYRTGQLIEVIDLIPNGSKVRVTNQNKMQYLDALAQYRLANSVKEETDGFLRGLNELIPDSLLSIFDENELELLMCGTGQFSIADFKSNHSVSGSSYEFRKVLDWFWTAVSNFTEEEMARLLQFTTGCSQLPAGGFAELCPRFQILAAPTFGNLPTAHTCFNQLCLPDYDSYEQFEKALLLAINEGAEGFGMI